MRTTKLGKLICKALVLYIVVFKLMGAGILHLGMVEIELLIDFGK